MTHITTYNRPTVITVGLDGLPNYLSTDTADPERWKPPQGYRLRVWCNGTELFHVVELDRERGWARTLPYTVSDGAVHLEPKDGVTRLYHGLVVMKVERIKIGTPALRRFLRRVAPNALPA